MTGASLEATANAATVRIVNGPLVAPVLSRVVGMLARIPRIYVVRRSWVAWRW